MSSVEDDLVGVLGLTQDATQDEIRAAYLKLVRLHPPDQEPDKFRKIHHAYELLCDPLKQATAMISRCTVKPNLLEVITEAEKTPTRIPSLALLSLGNLESPKQS